MFIFIYYKYLKKHKLLILKCLFLYIKKYLKKHKRSGKRETPRHAVRSTWIMSSLYTVIFGGTPPYTQCPWHRVHYTSPSHDDNRSTHGGINN